MTDQLDPEKQDVLQEDRLDSVRNAVGRLKSLSEQFKEIDKIAKELKEGLKSDSIVSEIKRAIPGLISQAEGALSKMIEFLQTDGTQNFRSIVDAALLAYKGKDDVTNQDLVSALEGIFGVHIPKEYQVLDSWLLDQLKKDILSYDLEAVDYTVTAIGWQLNSFIKYKISNLARFYTAGNFLQFENVFWNIHRESLDNLLATNPARVYDEFNILHSFLTGKGIDESKTLAES